MDHLQSQVYLFLERIFGMSLYTELLSHPTQVTQDQTVPFTDLQYTDLGSLMEGVGLSATVEALYEHPVDQGKLQRDILQRKEEFGEELFGATRDVDANAWGNSDLSSPWTNAYAQCTETSMTEMIRDMPQTLEMEPSSNGCEQSVPHLYHETTLDDILKQIQSTGVKLEDEFSNSSSTSNGLQNESGPFFPGASIKEIPQTLHKISSANNCELTEVDHSIPSPCHETTSAAMLFNQIQGIGVKCEDELSESSSSFSGLDDDSGKLFPELEDLQLNEIGSPLGSDAELDTVLLNLMSNPSQLTTNDFTLEMEPMECSGIFEDNASAAVPKLSLLLGETQNSGAMLPPDAQNLGYNVARTGPSSTGDDEESLSASDLSDDDYVPCNRRMRTVPKGPRHSANYNTVKRSRRKSPKLWNFLLDCLCDPHLNPSVICWENKDRGIFKISNTNKMAELWGRRLKGNGTNTKGTKNKMNYEKLSRAIRYYYKQQVINSVSARLTYQFGPNAKGWRARASGAVI